MAVAARREVVRQLQGLGLSERQALRLVGMSASTLRCEPRDDGNESLRERLKELAGQRRRHGCRMLHSRLRIDGWAINVKRTYRVYREEGLMVRKRRRKKLPVPERQPLVRPMQPTRCEGADRRRRLQQGGCANRRRHLDPGAVRDQGARPGQRRARIASGHPHQQRAGVRGQGHADVGCE